MLSKLNSLARFYFSKLLALFRMPPGSFPEYPPMAVPIKTYYDMIQFKYQTGSPMDLFEVERVEIYKTWDPVSQHEYATLHVINSIDGSKFHLAMERLIGSKVEAAGSEPTVVLNPTPSGSGHCTVPLSLPLSSDWTDSIKKLKGTHWANDVIGPTHSGTAKHEVDDTLMCGAEFPPSARPCLYHAITLGLVLHEERACYVLMGANCFNHAGTLLQVLAPKFGSEIHSYVGGVGTWHGITIFKKNEEVLNLLDNKWEEKLKLFLAPIQRVQQEKKQIQQALQEKEQIKQAQQEKDQRIADLENELLHIRGESGAPRSSSCKIL